MSHFDQREVGFVSNNLRLLSHDLNVQKREISLKGELLEMESLEYF